MKLLFNRPSLMKTFVCFLPMACLFFSGCEKKEAAPSPKATNSTAATGNPITAPVDYLGAIGKARERSIKTIDTVSLNQNVQLFYAQEGRFPKSLEELVEQKYLPSLPAAPYGNKIEYDPNTGKVKVVPK